ncbi:MAG: hypothetical protein WCG42_01585 [Parachlamydiaceae bacterium]
MGILLWKDRLIVCNRGGGMLDTVITAGKFSPSLLTEYGIEEMMKMKVVRITKVISEILYPTL